LSSYCLTRHISQQILKISSTRINARMDTSHYGLSHNFKSPEVVEIRWTDIKIALVKCLYFQVELNIGGSLSSSSGKSLKGWILAHHWAVPWKPSVCGHMNSSFFVWGFQSWNFSKNFRHTLLLNCVSPNHRRQKSHCHLYHTSYNVLLC
jgi:hypothetical protein